MRVAFRPAIKIRCAMQGAAAAAPRAFEWVRLGKAQSTSRAASLVVEPEPSGARRIYTGESDSLFACNARSEAITLSCQPLSAADYSQGVKRMFECLNLLVSAVPHSSI
jgi:hypothetical protein